MAKMVSQVGHTEIKMLSFSREGDKFVVISQMGIFDAKIYYTPKEVFHVLRLILNFSVLKYMIALPLLYLRSLTRHKKEDSKS